MLVACWAVKGGSGTTVVSTALAAILARSSPSGALLADLAGDVPAVLGVAEPTGPGLADWLASGGEVPADALRRLEVEGPGGLRVLPLGGSTETGERPGRGDVLAALLAADHRPVVVDCGSLGGPAPPAAGAAVAAAASSSLLVLRPCYLALRRAVRAPLRPSGVVVVVDQARSLGAGDVEDALGVPVRATVEVDPAVARAVDAGLFPGRLPRRLERSLRHAA